MASTNTSADSNNNDPKIKQEISTGVWSDRSLLRNETQDEINAENKVNVSTKLEDPEEDSDSDFSEGLLEEDSLDSETEDDSTPVRKSSADVDSYKTPTGVAPNGFYARLLGNYCLYECLWCHGEEAPTFTRWQDLSRHRHRAHRDILPKGLTRRNGDIEAYAQRLFYHRCKICGLHMPHDSYIILCHLERRHKKEESTLMGLAKRYKEMPDYDSNKASTPKELRKCFVLMKFSHFVQLAKDTSLRKQVPVISPPLKLRGKFGLSKHYPHAGGKATFEIGNLCTFKCKVCLKSFYIVTQYHWHIHQCGAKILNSHDSLTEARYHKCRLCLALLPCDVKIIRGHLLQSHQMRLHQYAFLKPTKDIKGLAAFEASIAPLPKSLKIDKFSIPLAMYSFIPEECITHEIQNLCEFRCDKCGELMKTWSLMIAHPRKCKDANQTFMRRKLVTARVHQCHLCKGLLLCDMYPLRRHLKVAHNMKLKDYQKLAQTIDNGKADHVVQKTRESRPFLSKSDLLPDWINPPGSLPQHLKTTTDVSNQCLFACHECSFQTKMREALVHHLNRFSHGEPTKSHLLSCLLQVKYHRCAVCARIIICLPKLIITHVQKLHGLSKQDYCQLEERQSVEKKT